MTRRRSSRSAELLAEAERPLAPPPDIAAAIVLAAETLVAGPTPPGQRSGWPSGTSYVWRFSALSWSRQVTERRERP